MTAIDGTPRKVRIADRLQTDCRQRIADSLCIWEVGLWRPTVSLVLRASQGQKYPTMDEIEEWRLLAARKPAVVPHTVEAAIALLGESGLGEAVVGGGGDGGGESLGRFALGEARRVV